MFGFARQFLFAKICGYASCEVGYGKSLVTPVFKNIDSTKKFSLRGIKVLNENNAEFGTTRTTQLAGGLVTIMKLSAKGVFEDSYTYYWTADKKGWYNGTGSAAVTEENDILFENGEGMLVTSNYKSKTDQRSVYFQTSGEVELYGKNSFPYGKSLAGNCLPRDIDLTEIKILNENCEEFGTTRTTQLAGGLVTIMKLKKAGVFDDSYTFYWTADKKGWYNGTGSVAVKVEDVTLKAGECFLLTNGYKSKTDQRIIYLQMPNPCDPIPTAE